MTDLDWNVELVDQDGHRHHLGGYPQPPTAPIVIGDKVWIGHDVTVKKGVHIGDGAIVASNSVVTDDVAPRTLVAGVPAEEKASSVAWAFGDDESLPNPDRLMEESEA